MRNILIFILSTFSLSNVYSQESADFKYVLDASEVREYAVDPNSGNLLLLTDSEFVILNRLNGDPYLDQKLAPKLGKMNRFGTRPTNDRAARSLIDNIKLDEGSGFLAYPAHDVVILLDWNSTKNIITAFKISDGQELWSTTNYSYAKGLLRSLAEAAILSGVNRITSSTPFEVDIAADFLVYQMQVSRKAGFSMSQGATAFLTPLEGSSKFLLKSGKEQILIDATTGAEKWRYNAFNLTVGFSKVIPQKNAVLLVHYNAGMLGENSNRLVSVLLDLETGEEKIRIVPESIFAIEHTRVIENKLVIGLQGLEVYDLNTGDRIINTLGSKKKAAKESSKFGQFVASQQATGEAASDPFNYVGSAYQGPFVYSAFTADLTGTYINPVSKGSLGQKSTIVKFDLRAADANQKPIWKEKVTAGLWDLEVREKELVVIRKPGVGKESWIVLDKETGHEINELKMGTGLGLDFGPESIFGRHLAFKALKKSLLIVDIKNWKQKAEIELKDLKVGRPQFMKKTTHHLVVVGTSGLCWIDAEEGKVTKTYTLEKARGIQMNDEDAIYFDDRNAYLVSFEDQTVTEFLNSSPMIRDNQLLFAPEVDCLIRISGNKVYGYNF